MAKKLIFEAIDGNLATVQQLVAGMGAYRAFFSDAAGGQSGVDYGYGESPAEAIVDLYHAMQTRVDFALDEDLALGLYSSTGTAARTGPPPGGAAMHGGFGDLGEQACPRGGGTGS